MVFNGSTNAFSNAAYAFPFGAYSMFAVYSNTTAPAASAYMNAVYGSNGFPMLGVYDVNKYVSARSVVANTGALVANVAASSNVLISATYTPSTFSPFINGTATSSTLAGTTLTTTGIYLGGPSNYFNGSISEVLVFGTTLTATQRQSMEGYLSKKWGITVPTTHPFYALPPFNRYFNPTDVPGCSLWLDGADGSSVVNAPVYTANSGVVTTLAGSTQGYADGTGAAARFDFPSGVAVLPNGNIVVADQQNHRIRLITPAGVVTTLAGGGISGGGFADGTGASASFYYPSGVAVLPNGNIVVADQANHRIRLVTYPGGVVTTLAGSGSPAFANGTGTAASFNGLTGVAVLPNGNIVVTDSSNNRIRLVTQAGVVTTLAGSGTATFADGTGTAASFAYPSGVAVLLDGNIVVADYSNNRIRLVTQAGVVTTLAGSGTNAFADGTGTAASFWYPCGPAVVSTGNIVVADYQNNRIRHVTYPGGVVTTLAGSGNTAFADGTGTGASFQNPQGVAVIPSSGVVVVADVGNSRIRLVTPPVVTVWNDKSGLSNTMSGTATWSGSNMVFNGSTNAFSNTTYVFPISAYSMFGVYSNTTAPASTAYMNAVYGSNGFPMLGTYDVGKAVTARSVVANTGALTVPGVWAARIASTSNDTGYGIATDTSGNVFVTGLYTAALTLYNTGGTSGATLPFTGGYDVFIAKYTSVGAVSWAARIAGASNDFGNAITTDTSGNVFVTGYYSAALTLYNSSGVSNAALPNAGTQYCFIAKYTSAGAVSWATRIAGTGNNVGYGIATDSSGNVFVTGDYTSDTLTLYNTGGTTGATLTNAGPTDCFVAKYTSAGAVSWAARIADTGIDSGLAIATDTSGNVFVTGYYSAAVTLYNSSGVSNAALPNASATNDVFIAKYTSAGAVSWAARIASTGSDYGYGIATDTSGNVFVTGRYGAAVTLYNTGGTTGATLPFTGITDVFVAKYSSAGAVIWAAQIAGSWVDSGLAIATDTSGNVLVTGSYGAALTLYNTGGTPGATLSFTGGSDCFIAKYTSAGAVSWAAQIAGTGDDIGYGIATDTSGNVFVTGQYDAAVTLYNTGGTTGATLPFTGIAADVFVAKYSPNGYIANALTPASSNVLVSATYTPSTFSPFVNGSTATTLAGTTLATTGIYVGGPSNYFNGSISELLIYASTLSAAQRQQVEGYLVQKWRLSAQTATGHPYKLIAPATSQPPQFAEVTPGNWTRDWQPYLQSLIATNNPTNASVDPVVTYGTGGPALSPALSTQQYRGTVLAPNGLIYGIPSIASNILIINPSNDSISYGTGGSSLTPALSTQGYTGGVLGPNGLIYGVPNRSSNILIINPLTNSVTYGTGGPALSPALSTNGYFAGTLAPNGNIYCSPWNSPYVLVINTSNNSLSYITPSLSPALSTQLYFSSTLAPNGKIYCIPRSVTSNVLIIDPITNSASYLSASISPALSTEAYLGGVLAPNGLIYCMPMAKADILIINPSNGSLSYLTPSLSPALSTRYFIGGILAPNGNIYGIPAGGNVLIINPSNNSVSYGSTGSIPSYNGGTLAPNGKIYCATESGATNILIISNAYTQNPSSNYCLSAYANKL